MSNSSQSTAEQSSKKFYAQNKIQDCKQYLKESGKLQKDKIIEWAKALEVLDE